MKETVFERGHIAATDDELPVEEIGAARTEIGLPPRGTPKNYLMAWLLVMLKDLNLHGYEIMKELKERFGVISDPGTVYRALRQLEREGYISSWWDPKEQGPARRVYALTPSGEGALERWSRALETYRENLDAFFRLYRGTWSEDAPPPRSHALATAAAAAAAAAGRPAP